MRLPLFATHFLLLLCVSATSALAVDFGKREVDGRWPDVVALARDISDRGSGPFEIFCSGVLIDPTVVLTAAHCFQEGGIRSAASALRRGAGSIRVYFGPGKDDGVVDSDLYEIRQVHLHPKYLRDIRGQADLAIVILKEPALVARENISPIALDIGLVKQRIRKLRPLTVVGYGFSEQPGPRFGVTTETVGVKHSGEVMIEGKTADEIQVVAGPPINRFHRQAPREGDSGGPAFFRDDDGTIYLAGIISRAARHNHGPFGAAFSLVRSRICWIEKETGIRLRPENGEPDYCAASGSNPRDPGRESHHLLESCLRRDELPARTAYTLYVLQRLTGFPGTASESECGEFVRRISSMTNLNLDATYISDVSPLAALGTLERLSIRDNSIQSVAPLSHLRGLRYLDISYNNVRDADTFSELEGRGLWLIGKKRQYWNIGRTNFIRLCANPDTPRTARATIDAFISMFGYRPGECVNANYELVRRRKLDIYSVRGLTDMSPLAGLSTLEELDLTGQAVADLSFLREIDDLRALNLDGNPVSDLSPILAHRNLRKLSLQNIGLEDISLLAALPRLRVLKIGGNRITDFSAFAGRDGRVLEIQGKNRQQRP